jgi:hypothetical protein
LGDDQSALGRPVNLNLHADLIQQRRSGVTTLSAHVEALRANDIAQPQALAEAEKTQTKRVINAFSTLYDAHGSLSEEMQNL